MMHNNVGDNKITIEAIKYILSRKDVLGDEMREAINCCVPYDTKEMLVSNPFGFTNYYIFNKIRNSCKMLFGNENWFLCVSDKEYESRLISVLRYECSVVQTDDIDTTESRNKLRSRFCKFKTLYPKYRELTVPEAVDFMGRMGC